jgi:hypothetical protein
VSSRSPPSNSSETNDKNLCRVCVTTATSVLPKAGFKFSCVKNKDPPRLSSGLTERHILGSIQSCGPPSDTKTTDESPSVLSKNMRNQVPLCITLLSQTNNSDLHNDQDVDSTPLLIMFCAVTRDSTLPLLSCAASQFGFDHSLHVSQSWRAASPGRTQGACRRGW